MLGIFSLSNGNMICYWDCCFSLPPLPSLVEVDDESVGLESKTADNYKTQCSWYLPSLSQVVFVKF